MACICTGCGPLRSLDYAAREAWPWLDRDSSASHRRRKYPNLETWPDLTWWRGGAAHFTSGNGSMGRMTISVMPFITIRKASGLWLPTLPWPFPRRRHPIGFSESGKLVFAFLDVEKLVQRRHFRLFGSTMRLLPMDCPRRKSGCQTVSPCCYRAPSVRQP